MIQEQLFSLTICKEDIRCSTSVVATKVSTTNGRLTCAILSKDKTGNRSFIGSVVFTSSLEGNFEPSLKNTSEGGEKITLFELQKEERRCSNYSYNCTIKSNEKTMKLAMKIEIVRFYLPLGLNSPTHRAPIERCLVVLWRKVRVVFS